jgi:hypothetical protein
MTQIISNTLDFIEGGLDNFGLLQSPGRRFIAISSLSGFFIFLLKPSGLFKTNGEPRPWIITNSSDPTSVPLNWFALSLLIGSFSILFI